MVDFLRELPEQMMRDVVLFVAQENFPDLIPGLKSPLTIGSFLLGVSLLAAGQPDFAMYSLVLSSVALKTNDHKTLLTAALGGLMRVSSNPYVYNTGFFAQGSAMLSAYRFNLPLFLRR